MAINFKKIFQTGWTNFKRNKYLSFGATGIMALTLILFLGLLTLQFLTSQIVSGLQDKIDISAYFSQDATEDQILALRKDVVALPNVETVNYVSRDQALADFKARHANDQFIQDSLGQLDSNPLSASLNIKTKDSSQYEAVANYLENSKFKSVIAKINFYENRGVIERIQGLSKGIKTWGYGVTFALALIAILVTFNTVRLTIYNQKQEIEIMRLVGASNWQIRGPYLAEGGLYGAFAAVISLAVFYPVIYLVSDKITSFAPNIDLLSYFIRGLPEVLSMVFGLGIVLGVVSSAIAIRRHLRI